MDSMERRRGNLPAGNNSHNSIANYQQLNLHQQQSFGSTDSADSNDSFRTQIPLPYYLPHDFQQNNSYEVSGGFTSYPLPSSNGSSKSLNPHSSPYIPQGNTPALPSAGFSAQGWGTPLMDGRDGSFATSYPQQPIHHSSGIQYQGSNPYQQQVITQFDGTVGSMGPQIHNPFGIDVRVAGTYSQFGGIPNNAHQYHASLSSNGQMGFNSFPAPDPSYANITPYGVGGLSQTDSTMYGGNGGNMSGAPNTYHHTSGSMSFTSDSANMYSGPTSAATSFISAPGNIFNNPNQALDFKSSFQKQEPSRSGSSYSNNSTTYFRKKSFASSERKELQTSSRENNNSQSRTESNPPIVGGPVQPLMGARVMSPEKLSSLSDSPESTRGKTKAEEDTTPLAKLCPSEIGFLSTQRQIDSKTPQLRSRRGQTIVSMDPNKTQLAGDWMVGARCSSQVGVMTSEELRSRGSPVNAVSLRTLNNTDSFLSATVASNPFDCMIPCRFTAGWGASPLSPELAALTQSGTRNPTLAEALDPYNLPFSEYCRQAKPDNYGVIKIKNIPYGTSRSEVLAFLGRNARLVNESENEPIHIIMERVTSKTLDCFVEFIDLGEAVSAVNRFENNRQGGRGRLGQRHVDVELSTQDALMKELFPKAKNVQWEGSRPRIIPRDPNDQYNSGFKGFIIKEELIMLLKHVESPQRTPFSKDCPQRSFECLVSTLVKYPWYMVDYITIEDRNLLHETTKRMLQILIDRIANNDDTVNLNPMLLKRVWRAALTCPGFTPSMKDDIVVIAGLDDQTAIEFGTAPFASFWNKLWTIGPKREAPVDLLMWYIAKIREACTCKQQLSLAEQAEKGSHLKEEKLFGDLDQHIRYGSGLNEMTLAQVAKIEWAAIESALRRAFATALSAPK